MVRLFAVISYAAFNAAFVYFLAFLGGFSAGHRPARNAAVAVAIDLGLLALFAVTHSAMARPAFKRRSTRVVGHAAERSVYVLIASAQLALICWQWRPLPGPALWSASGWAATALVAGQLLGFAIALASTFLIDHVELFGLRQAFGRPGGPPTFRTPSLYRIVRHPLYLGLLIALWSAPEMTIGRIALAAGLTLYVLVGARLEERDLVATFGDAYRRYQREVPMLVPRPRVSASAQRAAAETSARRRDDARRGRVRATAGAAGDVGAARHRRDRPTPRRGTARARPNPRAPSRAHLRVLFARAQGVLPGAAHTRRSLPPSRAEEALMRCAPSAGLPRHRSRVRCHRVVDARWIAVVLACALAACGGGGGNATDASNADALTDGAPLPDASDGAASDAPDDANAPDDGGPRVLEIGAGTYFVCARRDDGATWCWGGDGYMEMGALSADDVCSSNGFNPFNCRLMPAQRPDLDGVAQLAISGGVHGCVRRTDGTVACWGDNALGQLGDGTRRARREVLAVPGVTDVVDLSCATYHCCAARRDGSVMCWGANQWNESGVDPTSVPCSIGTSITSMCRLRAGVVDGVTGAVQVAAGDQQACARRSDGTVVCWGRNNLGQLGDGTMMDRTTPVAVVGLANVQDLRAGDAHTCARVASGELWCWGSNAAAQLGDGTTTSRGDARAVPGLANVRALSAGYSHTCAAVADGRLYCWGRNTAGQLGDGTRTQHLVPAVVPGLNNAGVVAASLDFTCAQTGAHGIACWGHNVGGQLGDGSQMDQNAPVAVNW